MPSRFGRSLAASPLQPNAGSLSPASVTHGAWSTPMNLMVGLALAALIVSPPAAKPTVTMMSNFWSTNDWMFLAMSADDWLTAAFGAGAPMRVAPSCAPAHEYSLKFLSLSVPTSVTSPILSAEPEAPALAPGLAPAVLQA